MGEPGIRCKMVVRRVRIDESRPTTGSRTGGMSADDVDSGDWVVAMVDRGGGSSRSG